MSIDINGSVDSLLSLEHLLRLKGNTCLRLRSGNSIILQLVRHIQKFTDGRRWWKNICASWMFYNKISWNYIPSLAGNFALLTLSETVQLTRDFLFFSETNLEELSHDCTKNDQNIQNDMKWITTKFFVPSEIIIVKLSTHGGKHYRDYITHTSEALSMMQITWKNNI